MTPRLTASITNVYYLRFFGGFSRSGNWEASGEGPHCGDCAGTVERRGFWSLFAGLLSSLLTPHAMPKRKRVLKTEETGFS